MSTNSRPQGLTDAQVAESRRLYGSNVLTPPRKPSLWRMFWSKFNDPLIIVLMVIGLFAVGVSCYEYWGLLEPATVFFEPVGIFVAIMLATGLGFYFELKAQKEFTVLNQENDHELVAVVRNGHATEIPKCDVVVGDILLLQTGQEIPADAQLLEAVSLAVDESSLTGEPVHPKHTDVSQHCSQTTYPPDHVYRGTQVMEGHGVARVLAVGDRTENGRIMQSLTGVDESESTALDEQQRRAMRLEERGRVTHKVKTPLDEQFTRLGAVVARLSYAIAIVIVVARMLVYFHENDGAWPLTQLSGQQLSHLLAYLLQTIMIAVTLVVVAVPEGLPMAVSLALANSMRKMLKTNNLVRRMHACETMGAATVICTDKTGTLTLNQMQVRAVEMDLSETVLEGVAVNATASLDLSGEAPSVVGNPTEGALLLWLREQGRDYRQLRDAAPRLQELPFSTERKYMATVVRSAALPGRRVVYVKGAPEILMARCAHFSRPRPQIEEALAGYQRRAMRTLGFAFQVVGDGQEAISDGQLIASDLTFLGVAGIEDPVRPDVGAAVRQCLDAGIAVKIVTGDTLATAREIGRQIGIWGETDTDSNSIEGPDFASLTDEQLLTRVDQLKIIARARPMDKKRLVVALQQRGHVVAVTGDGTNDAPALDAAHVGLSMGSGTSVAKEASDITIIDNSFASIARAVEWGRSLYQNIQRFLLFQLTVNVAACLLVLCGAFMGTESPLTVTQMLWVNLIMDTFAAFALSGLPPSARVMRDAPRNRHAFILDRQMMVNIWGVGLFFFLLLLALLYVFQHTDIERLTDLASPVWLPHSHVTPYELTLLFTIFVMTHYWYLFNARAFRTDGSALDLRGCDSFITIAVIIVVGQVLMVQVPVLNAFFNVVPLRADDWLLITVLSSLVLWMRELKHRLFTRKPAHTR